VLGQLVRATVANLGAKKKTVGQDVLDLIPDGKGLWFARMGYAAKNRCIMNAVLEIIRSKNCGVTFKVSTINPKDKKHGSATFAVTFCFKLKGKRKVMSFHSIDGRLLRYQNPKIGTRLGRHKGHNLRVAREIARYLQQCRRGAA
jgi:hypothetical protein